MDAERRAERRRLIRTHHPDRGGDPAVLIAELRRFEDEARATPATLPSAGWIQQWNDQESVRQPWPVSLVTRLLHKLAKPPR